MLVLATRVFLFRSVAMMRDRLFGVKAKRPGMLTSVPSILKSLPVEANGVSRSTGQIGSVIARRTPGPALESARKVSGFRKAEQECDLTYGQTRFSNVLGG